MPFFYDEVTMDEEVDRIRRVARARRELVAAAIWESRSSLSGNALNAVAPIRTYADAESVARHYLPDESLAFITDVARALWALTGKEV